jgi:hypothetical protein
MPLRPDSLYIETNRLTLFGLYCCAAVLSETGIEQIVIYVWAKHLKFAHKHCQILALKN